MSINNESPGEKILSNWKKLENRPFGKLLFSRAVGKMAAYTGTIKALITDLEPGDCQSFLKERNSNKNHLKSIHAVALINLGEMTSGLAVLSGMNTEIRGILTKMDMEYLIKAKGDLTAHCQCEIPNVVDELNYEVKTIIKNKLNETVAIGTFYWLLSRKK